MKLIQVHSKIDHRIVNQMGFFFAGVKSQTENKRVIISLLLILQRKYLTRERERYCIGLAAMATNAETRIHPQGLLARVSRLEGRGRWQPFRDRSLQEKIKTAKLQYNQLENRSSKSTDQCARTKRIKQIELLPIKCNQCNSKNKSTQGEK